jgi:hypothetical protein
MKYKLEFSQLSLKPIFPEASSSVRSTCPQQYIWTFVSGVETENGHSSVKFRRKKILRVLHGD